MVSKVKVFKAVAGECKHLDEVYGWQGLIPLGSYKQLDQDEKESDTGEIIKFLQNVKIKAIVDIS